MGFLDVFSPSGGKNAAQQVFGAQTDANQNQEKYANLNYGAQTGTYNQGAGTASNYLQGGNENAQNYLTQGMNAGQGYLNPAAANWQNLSNMGNAGLTQYGNLAGLNGADMQKTLENVPGYQFAVNQATQGIDRNAAATGRLASGNTDLDLNNSIQGLASGNYFNYLNALQPYFGLAENAGQGQQNTGALQANLAQTGYGNLANQANNYATNEANLQTGNARNIAGVQGNYYGTLGDLAQQQGANEAGLYTNMQDARNGAAANQWAAIMGLVNAGASAAGAFV